MHCAHLLPIQRAQLLGLDQFQQTDTCSGSLPVMLKDWFCLLLWNSEMENATILGTSSTTNHGRPLQVRKKKIYWKQIQLWPQKLACCQCSAKPSQSRKVRQLIYSWERLAAPQWCQCSTSAILSSSLSSTDRCGTVVAYLQHAILRHCVLLPPLHGATCFKNDTHSPLATPLDF